MAPVLIIRVHKPLKRLSSLVSTHTSETRTSSGIMSDFSKLTYIIVETSDDDIDRCLPKRRNHNIIKRSSSVKYVR